RVCLPGGHEVHGPALNGGRDRAAAGVRGAARVGDLTRAGVLRPDGRANSVAGRRGYRAVHCGVRGDRLRRPAGPVRAVAGVVRGAAATDRVRDRTDLRARLTRGTDLLRPRPAD